MEKRTDKYGRVIWGAAPDRTCLICYTGFSFDTMSKEGLSPCCNSFNHASVLWQDGPIIPQKESFGIPEGEGLWAKLNKSPVNFKTDKETFKAALYNFFKNLK